jgi:hypothetical protein
MRLLIRVTMLSVLLAVPAQADVTITSTMAGKGMGKLADGESKTYIKGSKMRADTTSVDQTSTIIDVDAQKFITVNHRKKEAEILDMAALATELNKSITADAKVTWTPNGQTKQILDRACTGYDLRIEIPMTMGGEGGLAMTMVMSGPVFIAKGVGGEADYAAFYTAAAEKGFIFTDPRAAKANAGSARGFTEMYRKMAESGGVPFSTELAVTFEGSGPMVAMMRKMGGMAMTTTVTAISADPIPADTFEIPAGYKTKTK